MNTLLFFPVTIICDNLQQRQHLWIQKDQRYKASPTVKFE